MVLQILYIVVFSFILFFYVRNISIPEIKRNGKKIFIQRKSIKAILLPMVFSLLLIQKILKVLGIVN